MISLALVLTIPMQAAPPAPMPPASPAPAASPAPDATPNATPNATPAAPPASADGSTRPSTWGTRTDTTAPRESSSVLRLDDATRFALQKQPQVIASQAQLRAQLARRDEARAPMLPQVVGTASASHAYSGTLRSPTGAPISGQYDYFSFGATATQLLWDFGQNYRKYQSADAQSDAFKENERATELTVLVNVRRAFFQARAQKALIEVAEETLANNQKHLVQVQGFVTVGTHPEIDLAQAKSDLANSRVQLVTARNSYEVAKAQLAQAVGGIDHDFEVADEELGPVDGEDLPLNTLVTRAISDRPELTSLYRQRDANELTVSGLKGGYLPTLSAQAAASTAGTGLDVLLPSWSVGAVASWPVFQGGLTVGQVKEANANLDVTNANLELERLQIRFDVESAWANVRGAKATIAAAQEAQVNANERLRLAEGRYASGVGTIIELGDAQVAKTNADATLVSAQFSLSSARAQLLSALGRR